MFFRFERQTLGLAGTPQPSPLCRWSRPTVGALPQPRRAPNAPFGVGIPKKTGGKGGKGANPEMPAKSMGCRRPNRWRKLAETGGNPQDDRYGEPTVPTLDLTQS
jgi:hypothetical protein